MTTERLRAILPELYHSRETHRQWRDHIRANPGELRRNPDIGDADFHDRMVGVYDERIDAINEAIDRLSHVDM